MAVDLYVERERQEGADDHDAAEHKHTLQRRVEDNRFYDVAGDQEFEPQQNAAAEIGAVGAIVRLEGLAAELQQEQDGRDTDRAEDDGEARRLQGLTREVRKILQGALVHGVFTIIAGGARRAFVNPLSTLSLTLSRTAVCRGGGSGPRRTGHSSTREARRQCIT